MLRWIVGCIALALSCQNGALAQNAGEMDAAVRVILQNRADKTTEISPQDYMYASQFLGAIDSITVIDKIHKQVNWPRHYCPPDAVDLEKYQYMRVFVDYLEKNKTRASDRYILVLMSALRAAFPCPK